MPEDKGDRKGDAQRKRKGESEKRALAVPFSLAIWGKGNGALLNGHSTQRQKARPGSG